MAQETPQFSIAEIVELAVQIEKNGRGFYNLLADKSKEKKASEIFKHLAEEEGRHIEDVKAIRESTVIYEPYESYPQEYFAYMNALAAEHVFTKEGTGEDKAKEITTDKEAIDVGLGFEKISILFYEGMKRLFSGNDIKIINKLIDQEKNHVTHLWELRSML